MVDLPAPPATLEDTAGAPRFGSYRGAIASLDLRRLRGAYQPNGVKRSVLHKRWLYTLVATHEVIALCAVADLSYTCNAFVVVVDLKEGRKLVDRSFLGLPRQARVSDEPGHGMHATFQARGTKLGFRRIGTTYEQRVNTPQLEWASTLETASAAPPLTVIAPIPRGIVNATQKWAGLSGSGSIRVGDRIYSLNAAVGGMDFTNGYLARHTAWRWAFACGRLADGTPIGLNLSQGINELDSDAEVTENALWRGSELLPLPRANFEFNTRNAQDHWRIRTQDGRVDLTFRPVDAHTEHRDYKIVRSNFVQPVGVFEGTILEHTVSNLPGVTEDQDVLW